MLREDLIDELDVEILPILAGGERTPMMFTSSDLALNEMPTQLQLLECVPWDDGRILLRYAVKRAR